MISPSDLIAKLENNSKNNRYKEKLMLSNKMDLILR